MEEIIVSTLANSSCSIQDVFDLVHTSFQQWLENGLNSAVANYSLDDYVKKTKDCVVIVAVDRQGILLGTHTLDFMEKSKCCFGKYLAVAPFAKRKGVGKMLLDKECELASSHGCNYILEDTAEKAYWSVKWHLKNGYKIVGYRSFSTNDYYSYLFRKQLVPSKKWDNSWYCKYLFVNAYVKTKMTKNRYGKPTLLVKVVKKVF